MERLPGQDEEPIADEEARAPAPPGEDGPPRPRGRAGLAAAAAIFGFATVALAYRATPWHRAAALVEDHPQRQGQRGTRLFHSKQDLATYTGQSAETGSHDIYVENSGVFRVGDHVVIVDPSGDSSLNEEGVVESVSPGKLTLVNPLSKGLVDGSIVIVQEEGAAPGAGSDANDPTDAPTSAPTSAPTDFGFDCDAGYSNWAAGWSEKKKKACCNLENKGCSFDCVAGQDMWESGWSEDKKKFCCQSESVGCDESPTDIDVDCDAGYDQWEAGWSEEKKKACCNLENKGCNFDCAAGQDMWKTGWSEDKKKFCCQSGSVGCDESLTDIDVDCDAGYDLWEAGWSEQKKKLCCDTVGKGCTFDCEAGYSMWAAGWSDGKKQYCCKTEHKGCKEPRGDGSGAMVMTLSLVFGILFCCIALLIACLGFGLFNYLRDKFNSLSQRTVDPKQGQHKAVSEWIFKPSDGNAIVTLEGPSVDSPDTGNRLEPREVFQVSEERAPEVEDKFEDVEGGMTMEEVDDVNRHFLKLADGRGWVLDREAGHEMCYRLGEPVDERWIYDPENGKPMGIREEPALDGEQTGEVIRPGDRFEVSEILLADGEVLALRLMDDRGWVFDEISDGSIVCRRLLDETWVYEPENGAPIGIRSGPDVYGEKTGHKLHAEETFQVEEIEVGDDGTLFLKLEDGRGWLFDKHPELGNMCRRVT